MYRTCQPAGHAIMTTKTDWRLVACFVQTKAFVNCKSGLKQYYTDCTVSVSTKHLILSKRIQHMCNTETLVGVELDENYKIFKNRITYTNS